VSITTIQIEETKIVRVENQDKVITITNVGVDRQRICIKDSSFTTCFILDVPLLLMLQHATYDYITLLNPQPIIDRYK